jgi:hypothetical protein
MARSSASRPIDIHGAHPPLNDQAINWKVSASLKTPPGLLPSHSPISPRSRRARRSQSRFAALNGERASLAKRSTAG